MRRFAVIGISIGALVSSGCSTGSNDGPRWYHYGLAGALGGPLGMALLKADADRYQQQKQQEREVATFNGRVQAYNDAVARFQQNLSAVALHPGFPGALRRIQEPLARAAVAGMVDVAAIRAAIRAELEPQQASIPKDEVDVLLAIERLDIWAESLSGERRAIGLDRERLTGQREQLISDDRQLAWMKLFGALAAIQGPGPLQPGSLAYPGNFPAPPRPVTCTRIGASVTCM